MIVISDFKINQVAAPNLPLSPFEYDRLYADQLNNVLRLYFNRLDNVLRYILSNAPTPISFPDNALDAFGRLVTSQPYTLFDSQNRYAVRLG